jgi:hypothetical protein
VVQNRVPDDKIKWEDANPKAVYDWIEKELGASSSSRQAELWSMVWGVKVAEDEDPNTVLTSIRSTLSDPGSSVPSETTVPQFVEMMSAFAMLAALPASYSLLALTTPGGDPVGCGTAENSQMGLIGWWTTTWGAPSSFSIGAYPTMVPRRPHNGTGRCS